MTTSAAVPRIHTGWLSASAFSGMFGFGIVMALLGAILPMISARLRFDLAQAGNLFLIMNATMLVGTFVLGPLLDRFGFKLTFVVAPLFVAGAVVQIANAASFAGLQVAIVLLGIGGGALNQATNTLIADLHDDERRKSSALNLLGVFFGFGALSIPFTIGALLDVLGLANILYCAAALVLVTALLSLLLRFPAPRQGDGVPLPEILRLARQPLIVVLAFLLFFESGNEWALGGFITTHLTHNLGAAMSTASWMLALYWAAMMAGRAVLSRLLLRCQRSRSDFGECGWRRGKPRPVDRRFVVARCRRGGSPARLQFGRDLSNLPGTCGRTLRQSLGHRLRTTHRLLPDGRNVASLADGPHIGQSRRRRGVVHTDCGRDRDLRFADARRPHDEN